MDSYKPNWRPIQEAPQDKDLMLWVYQPAIIYPNGQKFNAYICQASATGEAMVCHDIDSTGHMAEESRMRYPKYYCDELNVILEPTHFAQFEIAPPNTLEFESQSAPYRAGGMWDASSIGDVD